VPQHCRTVPQHWCATTLGAATARPATGRFADGKCCPVAPLDEGAKHRFLNDAHDALGRSDSNDLARRTRRQGGSGLHGFESRRRFP
jgi:hypothetical protein